MISNDLPINKEALFARIESLISESQINKEKDPKWALDLASQAETLSREAGLSSLLAASLLNVGMAQFELSNYQSAVIPLTESLILSESLNEPKESALLWLGRTHDRIGNYSLALEFLFRALGRLEQLSNKSIKDEERLANAYSQIGAIHIHLNEFDKAIDFYFKALDIHEKRGSTHALSSTYNNLGVVFRKSGSYDEALTYLKKSLALAESINNPNLISYPIYHIGIIQTALGNYKEATQYYQRGISLSQKGTDKYILCSHYSGMAEVLNAEGKPTKAISFHKKALKLGEEASSKEIIYEAHEGLYLCYKTKGDFKKAVFHHEQFHKIRQEVFNENSDKKIRAFQLDYDYKRAEQEAEIYRLRNVELANANKALEKADEVKNEFLAIAAHDLKSPLQTIMGFADLIKEKPDKTENVFRQADLIYQASKRMVKLVNDLLKTAAIESGKLELKKAKVDLSETLKHVVDEYQLRSQSKEILLEFVFEKGCMAEVDPSRIYDVFDNLLSNAIKFSPRGSRVEVRCEKTLLPHEHQNDDERQDDNDITSKIGKWVVISIKDEGQGFSEEDLTKIFGKFQRLSAKPTEGESSTGLGLSIVKQLIEMHGGQVWVESGGKDKGSLFLILLPLIE